jgi:hypothetical protein
VGGRSPGDEPRRIRLRRIVNREDEDTTTIRPTIEWKVTPTGFEPVLHA